jgi:sugar lactone lactonase YvrE
MNKRCIVSGVLVYLLALAVLFAACDTGTGGDGSGPGPGTITNDPVTYSNASENIELKIARTEAELSKAAITPQTNDWYILKHKGVEISRGTLTVNGTRWTFKVSAGGKVTSNFSATLSGETLTFSVAISYQGTGGRVTIAANTPLRGTGGSNSDSGWTVTTFAGSTSGENGTADGTGTTARFDQPYGITIDSDGNLYVTDIGNNNIRKITPGGVVTTIAGSTSGEYGSTNGTGTAARFSQPRGITIDSDGNFYVTDYGNKLIRKITPAGEVTTLAVNFNDPRGITIDSAGNLYVTDSFCQNICKITPGTAVTIIAGNPSGVFSRGYADGTGTAAHFNEPSGITIDSAVNLYVADHLNHNIRKITPGGVVTTIAGRIDGFSLGTSVDGTGTAARFSGPEGITIDSAGNLYVVELSGDIRKITPGAVVTTIARGTGGLVPGSFISPKGITIDSAGNLYVTDAGNHNIRKLTPPAGN